MPLETSTTREVYPPSEQFLTGIAPDMERNNLFKLKMKIITFKLLSVVKSLY